MSVALVALIVLWWGLIAYAVLGGADFGAGIWDLFAVGANAERQHKLINHALGPVWEANHVWLIFLIVGLFNVFPEAFAVLVTALFLPFSLALIGIVLRGAAFIFRYYSADEHSRFARWWGYIFSATSVITPFFLGAGAAAVASEDLATRAPNGDLVPHYTGAWTSPFALVIGCMAVALCATIAAIYLTVEARDTEQDQQLAAAYRVKALLAGAITAILGLIGLALAPSASPVIWQGMLTHALPIVIVTMLIGVATAVTLLYKYYKMARGLIVAETAFLLGAWGLAQYPYIVPPYFTIENSANDPTVITVLLIGIACGLVIVLPSLYFLFSVFKLSYRVPGIRQPENTQPVQKGQAPAKSSQG
jgi:cytochrome bd ubiquinol oxidase subunit II